MSKKKIVSSFLLLLVTSALVSCTILTPSAPPKGEQKIVLTFDDGPSRVTSEKLLDILQKHKVQAMFCYVGENVKKHPEVLRRAVSEGHQLGHHTITHGAKVLTSYSQLSAEVDEYQELVNEISGQEYEMTYFRPPFGVVTPAVQKLVAERGFKYAYVTSYIHEPSVDGEEAEEMMQRMKEKLQKEGGGAIVFHEMRYMQGDGYEVDKSWLPEAVDEFIRWAKAEGFSFSLYETL